MRTVWTSIGRAVVLCCLAAFLWTAQAEMQSTSFWTVAAQGSMAEVALSNAALQRAQSDQVKQFAQQMITDHTVTNQELTRTASTKSVTLPTSLSEKQQRDLDKLNTRSGADFDREYMKSMVQDHQRMIKLFQREADRGSDADAKAFASKALPTLQSHLTMAQSIYDTTKTAARGNGRGNSSDNNSNSRSNSNSNSNSSNSDQNSNESQYSNRVPNQNNNMNSNMNSNRGRNTNSNRGSNSNSNRGTNTNSNSNRSNTNNSNR